MFTFLKQESIFVFATLLLVSSGFLISNARNSSSPTLLQAGAQAAITPTLNTAVSTPAPKTSSAPVVQSKKSTPIATSRPSIRHSEDDD